MSHGVPTSASFNLCSLEGCVRCGLCATACHFYEVTGDPKYTPAYKLFPMARAHKKTLWPWRWLGGPKVTEAAFGRGRVDRGSCLPRPPTDPDVRD